MKMRGDTLGAIFGAGLLLLLTACSGDTQVADEGGIGGTGRAYGKITNFGSIFVNGVEYDTDTAEILVNGYPKSGDLDLGVGMVVTVEGSANADGVTGTATQVLYERELKGPVTAVFDPVSGTLDVLNQTVHVMGSTILENTTSTPVSLDGLSSHLVEVSGYSSGDGNIYATRIEVKSDHADGEEVELKGMVGSLDAEAKEFRIGGLTVRYESAALNGLTLADGLYVEVKGVYEADVLTASAIELEGDGTKGIFGEEGEELELEGVLTAPLVDGLFSINGQRVRLGSDVEFEGGSEADLQSTGIVLEVEGRFGSDGILVAEEVEFEDEGQYEFEGEVEAVSTTAITLFGQAIAVTSSTIMVDERDGVRSFTLANLAEGDRIEVYLAGDAQSGLVATKLVREEEEDRAEPAEIKGPVESGDAGTLVIAGVRVDVTALAEPPQPGEEAELSGTYDTEAVIFTAQEY